MEVCHPLAGLAETVELREYGDDIHNAKTFEVEGWGVVLGDGEALGYTRTAVVGNECKRVFGGARGQDGCKNS